MPWRIAVASRRVVAAGRRPAATDRLSSARCRHGLCVSSFRRTTRPRSWRRGWWPMAPGFVFLDSDGPVVLTPWSGGAYVLHFSANGSSPLAVPILFENGVEEYDFRWQWDERVLWARTSLYWRAYDLWDLGLSPLGEEPFLVVENSTAEPHPERGAVRLATQGGRHRIEHVWRDRWSRVEENQCFGVAFRPPGGLVREPERPSRRGRRDT